MKFTDCLNERSLLLWAAIAREVPDYQPDIITDCKLESLPEIDRLMRIVPGFDKEADHAIHNRKPSRCN